MQSGLLYRTRVEIVADEGRVRERLRHDDRREAVPAADIRDRRAPLELCNDTVKRRQPGFGEAVVIAGTEKASRGAEQTLRLLAPADTFAIGRASCRARVCQYV